MRDEVNFTQYVLTAILFISIFLFNSCDLIEGIFEAGVWVGVIISVLVFALVVYIVIKLIKMLF